MRRVLLAAIAAAGLAGPAMAADPATPEARGEYLARAADCVACHTAPGGAAFAGGLRMATPAGTISATNITPDPDTGIGKYTLAHFERALRRGIARDGHHLYPAMPYPSYAKITDQDVSDLYAFFMHAVPPIRRQNDEDDTSAAFGARWQLAGWNLLYAPSPGFTPDLAHDAQWNRGAYLVEGLGHCGACHTPRGLAWEEKALDARAPEFLAGASLDDWYAPSLRQERRTGLGAWSSDDVAAFLKTGHSAENSAYGSMRDVVNNSTPYLNDSDIAAVAAFLASLAPARDETELASEKPHAGGEESAFAVGASVYAIACQSCHREDGRASAPYIPALAGNPTVADRDPVSLINIVLNSTPPLAPHGQPDAYRMPQYREQLGNQQIAEVLTYIRGQWGNGAGAVQASDVAALRKRTSGASDRLEILHMR